MFESITLYYFHRSTPGWMLSHHLVIQPLLAQLTPLATQSKAEKSKLSAYVVYIHQAL